MNNLWRLLSAAWVLLLLTHYLPLRAQLGSLAIFGLLTLLSLLVFTRQHPGAD